jgi:glycosyltransferase involved in cell wall biosynthesis
LKNSGIIGKSSVKKKVPATVIILCYKRESFILEAVKSVVNNGYPVEDLEIIVVKAFDNPALEDALREMNCLIIHSDTQYIGHSFSSALSTSTGEIVFLLDDDDTFLPGKISTHLSMYEKFPDVEYIINGYEIIDSSGNPLRSDIRRKSRHLRDMYREFLLIKSDGIPNDISYLSKGLGIDFNSSRVSFRRSAIMPYLDYLQNINIHLDTGLFFVVYYFQGGILDIKHSLTGYRVHSENMSTRLASDKKTDSKMSGIIRYAALTQNFYRYSREHLGIHVKDPKFTNYCLSTEKTVNLFLLLISRGKPRSVLTALGQQVIYSIKCRNLRLYYRTILLSFIITILGLASNRFLEAITLKYGVIPNLA